MEFGFALPTRGELAKAHNLRALVERGEALGYRWLTASDHVIIPKSIAPEYPYAADGRLKAPVDWLEQLTALGWVAAVSERARLLTSVMVVPHRRPMHTAKVLATIDVLSGGRVTLGVGAGWMREEFEALETEPFEARGRVTDEYLEAMRELWTAPEPAYSGEYVKFRDIYFEPKPAQPGGIPIWVGGESRAALDRTVRLGDAWYPIGANPRFPLATVEQFAARAKRLDEMAEAAGRDPATIERAYVANWPQDAAPFEVEGGGRFLCTGTADQLVEDVEALAAQGVRYMMFNFGAPTLEDTIERVERFAADVMAKVSA